MLPWNEDDSDSAGWVDLLAGVIVAGFGVGLIVTGLSGLGGGSVNGVEVPVAPPEAVLAGIFPVGIGAVLAVKGYGFTYSDWKDQRRARQRRRARHRSRRR